MIRAPSPEPRLDGTGMIIVNPPFTLEGELRSVFPGVVKRAKVLAREFKERRS